MPCIAGALRFLAVSAAVSSAVVDAVEQYRYRDLLPEFRRAASRRTPKQVPARRNSDNESTESEAVGSQPEPGASDSDVQELYFVQRLDHFNPLELRNYRQRYFTTDRYQNPTAKRKVAFLCVGGEGPGFDKSVLVDSVHCTGDMIELARILHTDHGVSVHVYALEHRYYGQSYPDFPNESPVTTQNLRYLSSRQALEDLANFVSHMKFDTDDYQTDMPWVAFGGSYPGYLAGMARYKYPHLIHSAVSNSAPLHLIVDFPEYKNKVSQDLQYPKIGGSMECFDIVKTGHQQATWLVRENPLLLATMFGVCHPNTVFETVRNQELLLGDGLIYIPAQSNDPACDSDDLCNIEKICSTLIDAKQELQQHRANHNNGDDNSDDMVELKALAHVASLQRQYGDSDDDDDDDDGNAEGCLEVDWKSSLDMFSQPVVTDGGWRSWLWQTCTEVGFYQTCMESCPFSSFFHMVDMDLEICKAAYNVTNVYDNVRATAYHYGGIHIEGGSRILSMNGDVDPWSTLAISKSPSPDLPVYVVPGASHHFWTHMVRESDTAENKVARQMIYDTVMDWLGISASPEAAVGGEGTQAALDTLLVIDATDRQS